MRRGKPTPSVLHKYMCVQGISTGVEEARAERDDMSEEMRENGATSKTLMKAEPAKHTHTGYRLKN